MGNCFYRLSGSRLSRYTYLPLVDLRLLRQCGRRWCRIHLPFYLSTFDSDLFCGFLFRPDRRYSDPRKKMDSLAWHRIERPIFAPGSFLLHSDVKFDAGASAPQSRGLSVSKAMTATPNGAAANAPKLSRLLLTQHPRHLRIIAELEVVRLHLAYFS